MVSFNRSLCPTGGASVRSITSKLKAYEKVAKSILQEKDTLKALTSYRDDYLDVYSQIRESYLGSHPRVHMLHLQVLSHITNFQKSASCPSSTVPRDREGIVTMNETPQSKILKDALHTEKAAKTNRSPMDCVIYELAKSAEAIIPSGDYRAYFSSELALVDMEIQRGNFMNAETMLANMKLPPDRENSEEWKNIKLVVAQTITLYKSRIYAANQQTERAIDEMKTFDPLLATITESCVHFMDDPNVLKILLDSGVAQLQCRINKTHDEIKNHIFSHRREVLLLNIASMINMAALQQEMGNFASAKKLLEVADVFITEQNESAQVVLRGTELDALYLTNLLQKANLEKEFGYLKKAKSIITLLLKEFSSRKCENWDLRFAALTEGSLIFLASGQKEDIQSALRMLTEDLYLNTETLHIEPPENLSFNFKLALQQHRFEIPLAYGQILLLSQEFEKADKVFATLKEELINYHKENVSGMNYYRELFQALLGHARSLLQDKSNLTQDREKQIEAALSFIDDSLDQRIGNNKIHDNDEYRNELLEAHIDCKEMEGDLESQRRELKATIKCYQEALKEANDLATLTKNNDNKHSARIFRLHQNIRIIEDFMRYYTFCADILVIRRFYGSRQQYSS